MADFRLQQTGEVIQDRLNQIPLNKDDIEHLQQQATEFLNSDQVQALIVQALQGYSTTEEVAQAISTALARELASYSTTDEMTTAISNAITLALASYSTTDEVTTAINTALLSYYTKSEVDGLINGIEEKIPAAASAQNKLVDQQQMNSSIATATATYRGSYNLVSDLHLTISATEADIAAALVAAIATADNNDYCFVQVPVANDKPTEIASVKRYKFNGTVWAFEYQLNNSGFTQAQWDAINSTITSSLVAKLTALPTNADLTTLLAGKQDVISDLQTIRNQAAAAAPQSTTYTKTEVDGIVGDEETRARAAEQANAGDIDAIEGKIPSGASSSNKLVDQQQMNSSIATATATFRGTYNLVSDLHLTVSASRADIAAALSTAVATADNNDYAFVQVPVADGSPTVIARVERYKFNGTAWAFEFELNNSGFTQAQWDAINSTITSALVTKLSALPTNADLTTLFAGKQDVISDLQTIRNQAAAAAPQATTYTKTEVDGIVGDEETRAMAAEQANAGDIDAIEGKIPSGASSSNKLVDQQQMNSSIATATATFRGTYNLVSDLHLTVSASRADIAAALSTAVATADNNDYAFVQVPVADGSPTVIARVERYKFNGTAWAFEFELNNSGFTQAQWDAINSTITSALVAKLSALPTNADLTTLLAVKQDVISDLQTIRSGAAAGAAAAPQSTTYSKTEVDGLIANFITASVNNLLNYYLKSETYNKTEVEQLIAAVKQFVYLSVQTLPTASSDTMNKIYLVPSTNPGTQNVKDEYITIATTENDVTTYSWECIGSTQIDLTNYYTKSQTDGAITYALNQALANYTTTANLTQLLAGKIDIVNGATEDDIATFNGSGGVKDGGMKLSDLQPKILDGAAIGMGLGICDTDATTPAKVATLANFLMLKNVPVSIRFTKSINVDNATLNINNQGAKPIFIQGSALQPGVVKAEDVVTLIYDGTNWNIVEILSVLVSQSDLSVDMGLPSGRLWAIANLDATTQSGFAEVDGKPSPFKYECIFFSWGNNVGHNPISDSAFDYDWGSSNSGPYASTPGATLTANAGLSFDAARAILGAPWRDPSTEDFSELFDNIDYVDANGDVISGTNKLTTINSITGIRLKSKNNGNVIFFPCSGYGNGQSWSYRGSGGLYWSRSLSSQTFGSGLRFLSGGVSPQSSHDRFYGFARRAVQ